MHRVVLDTNILVSSFLSSGHPAAVVDLVVDKKITMFYSDPILQEYWEVLSRNKFNFSPFLVTHLMHNIVRVGIITDSKSSGKTTMDEDDQIFYDAAVEAQATLVTGNIKHFPSKPFIVTPAQFMANFYK